MNPVAFNIFGIDLMWYGIIISFGVMLGLIIISYTSKLKGVSFDNIIDTFLIAFPIAIIGARAYYVAFEFEDYRGNILSMLNLRQGGLAIHGGVIFGVLAAYLYSKKKKFDFLSMIDVVAPSLILAQGIGRWGNFINKEAHGGPVTSQFISKFPSFIQRGMNIGGTYYHPTFLYESIWDLIVFFILLMLLKKRKEEEKGTIIAYYAVLYSLGRLFIEGLRTDSLMILGLRTAQIVSLLLIIAGLVSIFIIKKRANNK
ncbi:prolipoprotein diacylglyceryl transferase [Clostridium algidicarnis]|uniref:Phosphatidylglycerol--prolipoprotein diacylglyceryl transferase n=1 Tax=Clostridium algidicarnis TaxID=37659 RepID=A0ABS6C6K0_9CLOT|nr:prolipoprotein diacylglyceryl transferase [Clostridium algidicarnis]MBB6632244.1 prolipoprotein diacylglyceryl transferase [Clostridium algidicarnis]MBU3205080.1 prolipoprotein diacylglyceryl transferase [Clostridium algidicarnis]MBU3213233.1 prolipoprotein diacylglyceryl transferase [Clostridium algidicarnis]MBU3221017.1 prolipoprotein diacylglyceryl transferase [Clostridium algidicarnis]MBU3223872.1 prolipoprotein diacylglyceryl transferase [Clostridium algidicarnis]